MESECDLPDSDKHLHWKNYQWKTGGCGFPDRAEKKKDEDRWLVTEAGTANYR